jgi:hypothetical protein
LLASSVSDRTPGWEDFDNDSLYATSFRLEQGKGAPLATQVVDTGRPTVYLNSTYQQ